ncbi:MAG: hypothetical protein KDD50_15705 [Bdellovibrionales bacterium]|nr:hypothetical protein [Bdellovibrionales bacterium]
MAVKPIAEIDISLWDFYGKTNYGSMGDFGPWDTEDEAHAQLKEAGHLAIEAIEEKMTGQKSGEVMDMLAGGILKPWNQFKRPN